ncbi:MAG: HAD hydrolase-like protein, partial [Patescibacteria group bacterium]|nr:HAD hydrolase-like protein [Patescibacteria group bacterium]
MAYQAVLFDFDGVLSRFALTRPPQSLRSFVPRKTFGFPVPSLGVRPPKVFVFCRAFVGRTTACCGVLSTDRFYECTLLPQYQDTYEWIQTHIFGNDELVRQWMRGKKTSAEINALIAGCTGIAYDVLVTLFEESVRRMTLSQGVMSLATDLKLSGRKIAIVTDNMDVFSCITVAQHRLDEFFDVIVNSADYGVLKREEGGR